MDEVYYVDPLNISRQKNRGVRNVVFKLNGTQTSARVVFKTRKQQSNASKYIYVCHIFPHYVDVRVMKFFDLERVMCHFL